MRQVSDAAKDQGHGGAGGNGGTSAGTSTRRGGRKNSDGQSEAIDITSIKKSTADLMRRYKKMENAKDDFNDACAKVAESTNVNARNLKKLVKASAKGNFVDVRRDVDQQGVLFEMVGEVTGGPSTAPDEEK